MLTKYAKRYVTEQDVKKALKIESFRNISKDKIMEFASMIPYMDKELAIAIINQFPNYADFIKVTISSYMQTCDKILVNNRESQVAVIHGYQTILDSLAKRMENGCETEQERQAITIDMISVADKINEVDLQNKKFLERMEDKLLFAMVCAIAAAGAAIGIHSSFGGGSSLPQVADNDDKDKQQKT